jgi:hypothetical protein
VVAQPIKRTFKEWLDAKTMTPDQVMRNRAGVSAEVLTRWAKTNEVPLEVTGGGRCLQVARALGVPPEQLDCGPNRRGMSEAGYELVLYAYGHGDDWKAYIESWGPPKNRVGLTPTSLAHRFNAPSPGNRVPGPTRKGALDALETELRALIRAHPGTRERRQSSGT